MLESVSALRAGGNGFQHPFGGRCDARTQHLGGSDVLGARDDFGDELGRPPLGLRIRVSFHRRSLDEDLAHGASPLGAAELALRARQLVARPCREHLARGLQRLVEHTAHPPSPLVGVDLTRDEICAVRPELLSLAARLRDERPVYAHGVASVAQLLRKGTGPASDPVALRRTVAAAAEAVDGHCAGDFARYS